MILYIDVILQYWKMKRTSNFALPLIKVVTQDTIEEIKLAHRNDILRLRVHLERIRNLSYMICRREKMKRSWLMVHRDIVQLTLSLANQWSAKSFRQQSGRRSRHAQEIRNRMRSLLLPYCQQDYSSLRL